MLLSYNSTNSKLKREKPNIYTYEGKNFVRHYVAGDGECGFTALGITREVAFDSLIDSLRNYKVVNLLKQPLREVMLENKFKNYIEKQKEFPKYVEMFDAYACAAERGNTEEASSLLEKLMKYTNYISFLQCYINYDVKDKAVNAGRVHPAVLQSLAEIKGIKLNIYTIEDEDTACFIPHRQYSTYEPKKFTREINLLFVHGNHFDLLEDIIEPENSEVSRANKRPRIS